MMLKKTVAALALGFGLVAGASANDITMDFGTIVAGNTFSNVIQKNIGSFYDVMSFNVSSSLLSAGSVSNLQITMPSFGNVFNVSDLSVKLYSYDSGTNTSTMIYDLATNPASTASFLTGSGLFAPGKYHFDVAGKADGFSGGQYVFAVTTAAAPVPEPESYAMLLAGLGLVGAIARRRKQAA